MDHVLITSAREVLLETFVLGTRKNAGVSFAAVRRLAQQHFAVARDSQWLPPGWTYCFLYTAVGVSHLLKEEPN